MAARGDTGLLGAAGIRARCNWSDNNLPQRIYVGRLRLFAPRNWHGSRSKRAGSKRARKVRKRGNFLKKWDSGNFEPQIQEADRR
jgi:hypothetical protein